MAKVPLVFKSFEGGWATDLKIGIKNSFAYSQAVDFRKSPSQLTVLPGPTREDGNVVKGLIQNEVMDKTGVIWAVDDQGYIYKRTTAGVWSQEYKNDAGTFGIDYREDADQIYIAGNTAVSLITNVTTAPVFNPQYYGTSISSANNTSTAGFNVNCNQTTGTLNYTPLTSISEALADKRFFQSDIEACNQIGIHVNARGTGNWTLTLHDGLNKTLATKTISNASLVNNQFNLFTFATPARLYVLPNARTYHVHVTSTVADGSLYTTTANDMRASDLQVYANRLIQTTNGMHPIQRFLQYECFGNSNYVSIWEPLSDPPTNAEWQRHKLVFPQGYEVCGLATTNEFLVVAAEHVTSSATTYPQRGYLFFWDGTSPTYNYFVEIPEGSPYGLHTYQNVAYYYAGGDWYAIASPTTLPVKIRKMPNSDTEFSANTSQIKVYPYASTIRRGIHLMAYPSTSTNTGIQFGVYSYGAVDKNWPNSFGYSYVISTGSQNYSVSNNLQIGMVKAFGDLLHISWRDDLNGGYGVDVVNNSSTPAVTSSWQSLIFDNGYVAKHKKGIYVQASFITLPSDASFILKYKIDRGSWVSSPSLSSATAQSRSFNNTEGYARFDIVNPSEFYEIQVAIDITSGTTTPTITSLTLIFDDNREQTLS